MKTLIVVLILLSFIQVTLVPLNLVLLVLILRAYLYPEKITDVRVTVAPNGGFTYTDPLYPHDGWFVRANPNGELYKIELDVATKRVMEHKTAVM